MKKFSIFLLSLIFSATAFAQQGNYFLSNFSPDTDLADNVCFDIAQDNRGVFYFATQAGILQYDGRSWDIIRTNGAAYAIELAENGELYVAGPKGFGKLLRITMDWKASNYYTISPGLSIYFRSQR
jgi:ligand-binding sensor domain-containing protein